MKLRAVILFTFMLLLAIISADRSKNPTAETFLVTATSNEEYTKAEEPEKDKDDMPPSALNDDWSEIAELPDGIEEQIAGGFSRNIAFN